MAIPEQPLPGLDQQQQLQPAESASSQGSGDDAAGCSGGGGGGGKAHLKFVDKDEHVYFWFPLLAGLSELTFDPRYDHSGVNRVVGCGWVVGCESRALDGLVCLVGSVGDREYKVRECASSWYDHLPLTCNPATCLSQA